MKTRGTLILSLLSLLAFTSSSCTFKANTKCPNSDLLNDTLLFKNPTPEVIIDKSWCLTWQDFSFYLKGRIQNDDSLENNIQMLGIPSINSFVKRMPRQTFREDKVKDWFNIVQLEKDDNYLKYYKKFDNTSTYKWIYYREAADCDTFYIALVNT